MCLDRIQTHERNETKRSEAKGNLRSCSFSCLVFLQSQGRFKEEEGGGEEAATVEKVSTDEIYMAGNF